jgi:hypothetical protein
MHEVCVTDPIWSRDGYLLLLHCQGVGHSGQNSGSQNCAKLLAGHQTAGRKVEPVVFEMVLITHDLDLSKFQV